MAENWSIKALFEDMTARGEHAAVISVRENQTESWSFNRLADQASKLAHGLLQEGIEPGEPVVIFAPDMPEWIVAALGIGGAGATIVPIDALASNAEAAQIITDSGCRHVFTTEDRVASLRQLSNGDKLSLFLLRHDEDVPGARPWTTLSEAGTGTLPDLSDDAHACLTYTSGTTGKPKAFYLSYANIGANVVALSKLRLLNSSDRALLPLPFNHAYPWIVGVLTTLSNGVPIILPESISGPHILTALQVARPTVIIGVPRLYETLLAGIQARLASRSTGVRGVIRLLWSISVWWRRHTGYLAGQCLMRPVRNRIAPAVRLVVSGGARLDADSADKLEGLGWQVLSGYGLAETASIFTGNVPWRRRIGSEGKPVAGGEVRIGPPNETGVGEIQLKGPSVFSGYHNNAAANAQAFTDDGWFRTGDLGYLDKDGFLYVTGRSKEVIVLSGGKNIYPEEIEKIYEVHPQIRDIAILEHKGALVALIVPDLGAISAAGALRVEDAIKVALTSVSQHLPTFQRVTGFVIPREPLPQTRLGKYRRFLLPQIYERALATEECGDATELSDADRAFLSVPPASRIWSFLEKRFPDRKLTLETSTQLDLGLDSFEWMAMSVELEGDLGIRLTEKEIARIGTLRDLVNEAILALHQGRAASVGSMDVVERDRQRWLRPTNPVQTLLGYVLFGLNRILLRSLFKLRVRGLEQVPDQGPFIITPNHVSDLDPLVIAAALPLETVSRLYWAADVVRVFSGPVSRFFCRVAHIFPVDERKPASAIGMADAVLQAGNVQVWFPEGWRSPDGKLHEFQTGIGRLIFATDVPVVPAYISGAFEAWPRDRRWPTVHSVQIVFGKPIDSKSLRVEGTEQENYQFAADRLRTKVAELGRSVGAE